MQSALSHAVISNDAPDSELAMHAASGNERAFEMIMRRNNQRLFRTARSILETDADAEDAVQEAYLLAWRNLGAYRSEAKLSTWLVRIVVNEALGRLRRKSADIISLDAAMNSTQTEVQQSLTENADSQPDRSALRGELRRIIESHLDQLPDMYRTVFMLRAVEDMSTTDVSDALQLPEATVRTRLMRARSLLRERLASEIDVTLNDAFLFDGKRCDRIVSNVLEKARENKLSKG